MKDLSKLLESLLPATRSSKGIVYSVEAVRPSDCAFIGNDENGNAVAIIVCEDSLQSDLPDLRLEHFTVDPNRFCIVSSDNSRLKREGRFCTLTFTSPDQTLRNLFLRLLVALVEDLPSVPTKIQVMSRISQIVDLFTAMKSPPQKSLIGIWGELIILDLATDKATALSAWHDKNSETCDFVSGNTGLEVKCTTRERRIHRFSLEQVTPTNIPESTFVASMLTRATDEGMSVSDLANRVREKISERKLILKLDRAIYSALGTSWVEADQSKFDLDLTFKTLKYYNVADLPKPTGTMPPGVSNLRFDCNLEIVQPLKTPDLKSNALLRTILI